MRDGRGGAGVVVASVERIVVPYEHFFMLCYDNSFTFVHVEMPLVDGFEQRCGDIQEHVYVVSCDVRRVEQHVLNDGTRRLKGWVKAV